MNEPEYSNLKLVPKDFTKRKHFKNFEKYFFLLYIQSFVVISFLFPQFPDSKCKTKKGIFASISGNSKRLVASSRYFCFSKFCPKKNHWVQRKKSVYIPFSWSLLKITYFQKSYTCIGCFWLVTKLNTCMELVFTTGFLHTFSTKMFLIKYPFSFNTWGSNQAS